MTPKQQKIGDVKQHKTSVLSGTFGRPSQNNIGSVMEISDQSSDVDMYMSGLSRPTNNNDKQTAQFNSSVPSYKQEESQRRSVNISNEMEKK